MNTFYTKCKDADPIETVLNIIEFFKSHGFTITEFNNGKSEGNTYSISLTLKYKNFTILITHGKGATPEFARASGYAELYERYSTRLSTFFNTGFCNDYLNKHYADKGYYISRDEKIMTYDEINSESELLFSYLGNFINHKNIEDFCDLITNKRYIGVPYYNFIDGTPKYYDPRLLYRMSASNGLAAGNTYEEACVQGISEIFERYIQFQSFKNLNKEFVELDLTTLKNPVIQNMINGIESTNNIIRIFDLSYTFHAPVLMSAIFNKMNSRIYLDFGSAPEFDIAVERIITESYQGITTLNDFDYDIQQPMSHSAESVLMRQGGNSPFTICQFPEEIFLNAKKVACYESPYFLYDNSMSNTEMLEWYKEIAKNLALDIYIHDYAMTNSMHSVHVFVNNINVIPQKEELYKNNSPIIKNKNMEMLKLYKQAYQNIVDNNYEVFYQIWEKINKLYNQFPMEIGVNMMMSDWVVPFYFNLSNCPLLFYQPYELINNLALYPNKEMYEKAKRITTIFVYRDAGYTDEQIIKIFNYFNADITKELKIKNNNEDLIKYIVFDTLRDMYQELDEVYTAMESDI